MAGVSIRITETRPFCHRLFGRRLHRSFVDAIGEADGGDAHVEEGLGEQCFRAAIKRLRMQDGIARTHESEQRRGDRRHAGGKQRAAFRSLIDRQPILDDLAVGMIEAGIDQPGPCACRRFAAAGDEIEEIAALFGRLEHEGRGQEHRRLDRALGEFRIVAVVQHQRFGMQFVIADMGLGGMWSGHDSLRDFDVKNTVYIKFGRCFLPI